MKSVKILFAVLLMSLIPLSVSAYESSEPLAGEEISLKDMKGFITDLDGFYLMSTSAEDPIYNALKNHDYTLDISDYNLKSPEVTEIIQDILYKRPEAYALDSWKYYTDETTGNVTRILFYYKEDLYVSQNKIKLYNIFKKCALSDIKDSMSDIEKIFIIHDYIVSHLEYDDLDEAAQGEDEDKHIYNAVDMAVYGKGVCQAYTQMFYDFCMDLNISCGLSYSNKKNHIWNIVKIDGKWYNIDLTFDDPIGATIGQVSHAYMLLSGDALISMDSERADATDQSLCTDSYYDNMPWKKAQFSSVVPYGGKLYYVGGNALWEYDQSTGDVNELASYNFGVQLDPDDNTVYAVAGAAIYDDVLYYTYYKHTGEEEDHDVFNRSIKSYNLRTDATGEIIPESSGYTLYSNIMIDNGVISYTEGELLGESFSCAQIDVGRKESFIADMGIVDGRLIIMGANALTTDMTLIFTGDNSICAEPVTFSQGFVKEYAEIPDGSKRAFLWTPSLKPICESVDIE